MNTNNHSPSRTRPRRIASEGTLDTADIQDAQQLKYIAYTGRHPMVTDAYRLGFLPGLREDYNFQVRDVPNVELPIGFLDNCFEDPDINRYLTVFRELDPSVAVLGDAYSKSEAETLNNVVSQLRSESIFKELIVVPKCKEAFSVLSKDITLGYPLGFSDLCPEDFSDLTDWRGRHIHILGGAPSKQYPAIQKLTQPVLSGDPPANIVGCDWNGIHKVAYLGEYWSREGWQPADHLSIRETVRRSLSEIRAFWKAKGLWPETEPIELSGQPSERPDELVWIDDGGNPIDSFESLEQAYIKVNERDENTTLAFQSETCKKFVEYRDGI